KGSHREQPQCDRNQARPPDRGYAPPKITDDRIRYAPERDRSFSQNKRTERTTAGKQIETMVRGGCYRDGKDSFDFICSRGSNRRSPALSGNMTPQRDCDLCANEYTAAIAALDKRPRGRREHLAQAILCRRRHQPSTFRPRSHRRCWSSRPDLGERWPSGLV